MNLGSITQKLQSVLYIPGLSFNSLSCSKLDENRISTVILKIVCGYIDEHAKKIFFCCVTRSEGDGLHTVAVVKHKEYPKRIFSLINTTSRRTELKLSNST